MSGDRMVRFGENNWIRASLIESVYPFDKDLPHKWEYQVLVRLIGSRRWTYTVSEAPVGTTPERIEVQEAAKMKRNAYLNDFLLRMGL